MPLNLFKVVLLIWLLVFAVAADLKKSSADTTQSKKQKMVFVVNTGEKDFAGSGATSALLNEHRWIKSWQKVFPDANVVRIRANSELELHTQLSRWMQPNPDEKEVAGLAIYSHGTTMELSNNSGEFLMVLPRDIKTVLKPIVGRFADGARIFFSGCNVAEHASPNESMRSLNSIAESLELKNGLVYANKTLSFTGINAFKTHPLSPDIRLNERLETVFLYATWPLSVPLFVAVDAISNRGYILEKESSGRNRLLEARAEAFLEPTLRVLQGAKVIWFEQPKAGTSQTEVLNRIESKPARTAQ